MYFGVEIRVPLLDLRLVEFAFQRYYRLDASGERGLCDRAARSCERCPAALKPAVSLAHLVKDLTHPQVHNIT